MQTFNHTIADKLGIHARPAGLLVQKIKEYKSTVTIMANGKSTVVKGVLGLMTLGAKQGTELTVTVEGPDEEIAAAGLKEFLAAKL